MNRFFLMPRGTQTTNAQRVAVVTWREKDSNFNFITQSQKCLFEVFHKFYKLVDLDPVPTSTTTTYIIYLTLLVLLNGV